MINWGRGNYRRAMSENNNSIYQMVNILYMYIFINKRFYWCCKIITHQALIEKETIIKPFFIVLLFLDTICWTKTI